METKKRLIDANELRQTIESKIYWSAICDGLDLLEAIDDAPTVDAAEVVHGHWIDETTTSKGISFYRFVCSACGHIFWNGGIDNFNYCPNCGAKMDGGKGHVE